MSSKNFTCSILEYLDPDVLQFSASHKTIIIKYNTDFAWYWGNWISCADWVGSVQPVKSKIDVQLSYYYVYCYLWTYYLWSYLLWSIKTISLLQWPVCFQCTLSLLWKYQKNHKVFWCFQGVEKVHWEQMG